MAASVIVFPLVTKHITGEIIPNRQFDVFLPWVLVGLLSFFIKDALNCARIILNNHFEQRVIFDIRSDLYRKIQRLPLRWFDSRRTGDIMTRVVEDVTAMERILIDGIELGLISIIQILAVGITMYWLDPTVALWATLPIPFLAMGAWIYTRKARGRYKAQRDASSDLNAVLHDNIAGIRQIKAYAAEKDEHEHFNGLSGALRKATLRIMKWWAFYNPSMSFFNSTGYVLVLGFGGYAVMQGTMQFDELLTFFLLLSLFYEPVSKLHQLNQMALSSRAAADRVFEILDSDDEPDAASGDPLPRPVRGAVEFNNVSFSYDKGQPTLDEVSLIAEPGQTIALAGSTGAGKSTIVNLLCRFYEYDNGSVLIDGKELNTLAKGSLRDAIGYVTQEAFLFNGTVRENLSLADRHANDDAIWKALEAANDSFIDSLPQGYDTLVGERGLKLSGGEKQRLAIARVLLKNPILLLDEATASVDSIMNAIDNVSTGHTTILIAHRLSTIAGADHVLQKGRVIEEGPYDVLINQGGKFAELANTIK